MTQPCLSFVCPKKLDELQPLHSEVYYCNNCQRKVFDLRQKSSNEVKKLQDKHGTICGIIPAPQKLPFWIKQSSITLGFLLLSWNASAQDLTENSMDSLRPQIKEPIIEDHQFIGVVVEKPATPVGGEKKFYVALASVVDITHFPITEDYIKVYISFTVDTSGNLTDYKILKGYSDAFDEMILDGVKSLNYKFIPGEQSGKKVKTRFTLPITIQR